MITEIQALWAFWFTHFRHKLYAPTIWCGLCSCEERPSRVVTVYHQCGLAQFKDVDLLS